MDRVPTATEGFSSFSSGDFSSQVGPPRALSTILTSLSFQEGDEGKDPPLLAAQSPTKWTPKVRGSWEGR